jgi:hypothetical protein
MEFTNADEVISKPLQLLFYTSGIKVEADAQGDLYYNGKKATISHVVDTLYSARGIICRYKKPKKVIGARKRKKALAASVSKYSIKLHFYKG